MDGNRPRRVTRYFSAAPPPNFPLPAGAAVLAGCALIVLAFVVTSGVWTAPVLAVGAFTIYGGWNRFQEYADSRTPTDSYMDTVLTEDLRRIAQKAAADHGGTTTPPHAVEPSGAIVAIDLTQAESLTDKTLPRVRCGDDEKLRAERYRIAILFLDRTSVTIYQYRLDFRTGQTGDDPTITEQYANVGQRKEWEPLLLGFRSYAAARAQACWTSRIS